MRCAGVLKTTVPLDIKARAKAIADSELLTEAAWLKQIVVSEIRAAEGGSSQSREATAAVSVRPRAIETRGSDAASRPIYVRLRSGDRLLLDARAAARGMRPATYVSVLTRAHLRALAPLPKEEYLALKRSIGELAAIGRNINQIAKAANTGGKVPATVREEFRAMLKICEALRVNTKMLLKANETSWSTGHD